MFGPHLHLPQLSPQRRQIAVARKLFRSHAHSVAPPRARPHLVLQVLVLFEPTLQGLRILVACVT